MSALSRTSAPPIRFVLCQILSVAALVGCGGGGGSSEEAVQVSVQAVFPVRGSALGGSRIQLDGQGFTAGTQVKLDGLDCEAITVASPSSLTCVTPAHRPGAVDVQVLNADGGQAIGRAAYTYRASGSGVASFGILAILPGQGHYPAPFSATLESIISGFDLPTAKRSWTVDGRTQHEGDTVLFEDGSHTVTLKVRDATGDEDSASYSIVVGSLAGPTSAGRSTRLDGPAAGSEFSLSPGASIAIVNSGFQPLLNPRFIGAGKPDYVDWARYLSSLARLSNLPTDASESSRATLLEAAWKDLSFATVHVCSPGREGENIYDPALLARGYGYECCSEASRALAFLGAYLDIPARVRSTWYHEFPEFTVGGRMFILDPDARFRFWGDDQMPLSAWTSDSEPVSLMNVASFLAQTPGGEYYQVQSGGYLPYGQNPEHSEQALRSFYFENIIAETIWEYHEAFSGSNHVLYPNEKMAFRQTSTYAPLQRLNSDGTPTAGTYAPAVGKVVIRRLWSIDGPRKFQPDDSGHWAIPLNDLPYPVQDLVFHFSKPVDPAGFRLVAGGKTHRMGDFTANTWTVSAQQLRAFTDVSDLAAIISRDQNLVAVDVGMQFNPGVFGSPSSTLSLAYADDSGVCQRNVSVTAGGSAKDVSLGASACDGKAPQRVDIGHSLQKGQPGVAVIASYGNSYQGTWGLAAAAGIQAHAELSLPRTRDLPGVLRVSTEGNFSDWQIFENGRWATLATADAGRTQWIQLPAVAGSTTRLRATLRHTPANDTTYLSRLSLTEGRDVAMPFGILSSTQ